MNDPRLDERHLPSPRREQYCIARAEVVGAMGQATSEYERAIQARGLPFGFTPDPATYALRDMRTGRSHFLRIGINTIGRHPDNDIVLHETWVSRRHCAMVVHATGGCEVRDTASRNGTGVNDRLVEQVDLIPGDMLQICGRWFILQAEPLDGSSIGSGSQESGQLGLAASSS
jgi:hypothetical protein